MRTTRLPEAKPCQVCGRPPTVEQCAPWPPDMGSAPWYAGCYEPGSREHVRCVNGDSKADAILLWNED